MLTKTDATTIRQIVKKEVVSAVKQEVKSELTKQLKPVNQKLSKLQKALDTTIKFFDRDILSLRNDFDNHLQQLH